MRPTNIGNVKLERFPSIEAMNLALTERTNNKKMQNCDSSNRSGSHRKDDWYRTTDLADAKELMKSGWDEYTAELTKSYKQAAASDKTQKADKRRVRKNVVGGSINTASYLRGEPKVFRQTYKTKLPTKVVVIYYDTCASGSNDSECLLKSGLTLITVIMRLERSGYRVELNIGATYGGSYGDMEEVISGFFLAKSSTQQTNLKKLVFPIANPSMLRRIMFRYLETHPTMTTSNFRSGYGYPIDKCDNAERVKVEAAILKNPNDVYLCYQDIHNCKDDASKVLAKHFNKLTVTAA
jgi:hypothetical protein